MKTRLLFVTMAALVRLRRYAGSLVSDSSTADDLVRYHAKYMIADNVLHEGNKQQAEFFNALQKIAVEESPSKIPLLFALDVIHGYRTIFPVPLAMAASWDPSVAERAQAVAAKEARAAGLHWTFGPMVDIARDARWGRVEETFGEDPTLVSNFGVAYVKGLQGESLKDGGVMATGKHFFGHSLSQGGLNCGPVHMGMRDAFDIYLAPFQAAIRQAGLASIMNAYPEQYDHLQRLVGKLMTEVPGALAGFRHLHKESQAEGSDAQVRCASRAGAQDRNQKEGNPKEENASQKENGAKEKKATLSAIFFHQCSPMALAQFC